MPQYAVRKLMCDEEDAKFFDKNTCIVLDKIKLMFQPNKEGKTKLRVYANYRYWLAWTYNRIAEEAKCTYAQARRAIRLLKAARRIITMRKRFNGHPTTHIHLVDSIRFPAPPPKLRLLNPRQNSNNSTDLSFMAQNSNNSTDLSRVTVLQDNSDLSHKTNVCNTRTVKHESEKEDPLPHFVGQPDSFSHTEKGETDMPEPTRINGPIGDILRGVTVVKDDDPRLSPSVPAPSPAEELRPAPPLPSRAPVPAPPANRRASGTNPRAEGRSPRQLGVAPRQQGTNPQAYVEAEERAREAWAKKKEEEAAEKRDRRQFAYRKQLGMAPINTKGPRVIIEDQEMLYRREKERPGSGLLAAVQAVRDEIKKGTSTQDVAKTVFPGVDPADLE